MNETYLTVILFNQKSVLAHYQNEKNVDYKTSFFFTIEGKKYYTIHVVFYLIWL